MSIFHPGDLVTLKGMKFSKEKPIGMVRKIYYKNNVKILWLNKKISNRYALTDYIHPKKLEIVSQAQKE